jgi:hypothetical protein
MHKWTKILVLLTLGLGLTACQWSLEPLPHNKISIEDSYDGPSEMPPIKDFSYIIEGKKAELFEEIWLAVLETAEVKVNLEAKYALRLTVQEYDYFEDDPVDWVPGVLFPGLVPFGPLAFWWLYEDLSVDTPSVKLRVLAEIREKGNNGAKFPRLIVGVESSLGITTEDNLARAALAQAAIKVVKWLEDRQ